MNMRPYALDADLLLTQTESARRGGDSHDRSNALRPLVERYRDTDVEAKVIRIAMIMALELGNNKLVNELRDVIARRMPGNIDLINFQRDKLAGQVFGVPFIGTFPWGKDNTAKFPMDFLGTTTAIYFWSKEDGGLDDLKELAEAWKIKTSDSEVAAAGRFRFVSMNLDDLADGGESILREHGLDWPALRMEGGTKNPIYKAYCRFHPRVLRISPTGYAAIYLTSSRDSRGYERNLQSWLARQWTKADYNSHLQSIFAGEFLVIDPEGPFDPSAPLSGSRFQKMEKRSYGQMHRFPRKLSKAFKNFSSHLPFDTISHLLKWWKNLREPINSVAKPFPPIQTHQIFGSCGTVVS